MKSKRKKLLVAAILIIAGLFVKIFFFEDKFYYAGTIEATKVDISSRVSSVISQIHIKEGDSVQADQILLNLSCEDIKIAAEQAQKDYDRALKLFKQGSVPMESFEHLKLKYDDTLLKSGWCSIKSPIAGTVLAKYREQGELVQYGTKLFTLADLSDLWAYIYVPQPMLAKLKLGMEIYGYMPELEMKAVKGRIVKISEEAEFTPKNVQTRDERTRLVFAIKVAFENPENILKPGMSIEVDIK